MESSSSMHGPSAESAAIIVRNWQRVHEDVAEACRASGRSPTAVQIVGVTKYVDWEFARQLFNAGCTQLGENRPQSLWAKLEQWQTSEASSEQSPQWHFIGHLQRNKVRRTLPTIVRLHSLDSRRLATAISQEAVATGRILPTLVEVNVTLDNAKTGVPAAELEDLLARTADLPGLRIDGLMAMSSLGAQPDAARREFAKVRQLRDAMQQRFSGQLQLSELSMGMSGDFAEAIAEGATLVRIGTSLWEGILDAH